MSNPEEGVDLLSREEVEGLASGAGIEEGVSPFAQATAVTGGDALLRDVSEILAENQTRSLSTLYQRTIRVGVLGCEVKSARDLLAEEVPWDLVIRWDCDFSADGGFFRMDRELFYGWFNRAFGAKDSVPAVLPERRASKIEERFFRRIANDIAQSFSRSSRDRGNWECAAGAVVDRTSLHDELGSREFRTARFSVEGFVEAEEAPVFEIALPSLLAIGAGSDLGEQQDPQTGIDPLILERVTDTELELRARLATADVTLSQVARLKEGDVIPLEGEKDGGILLLVEGKAKFRGIRGTVGERLAVQVSERI